MFRVAVIGLGYFSQFHLQSWTGMAQTEVIGGVDPDPARCAWAASEFGISTDLDGADVLAQNPDIVDIVAPPRAHVSLVRQALAPGRVIICQKPFTTSMDEAQSLVEAAQAIGAHLVIHENFRFQPWHRAIKSFLESGRMGQVFAARFDLRPGDGRGANAYLERQPAFQSMPRLLVHETGVHFLDLFSWMFGEVTAVYADLRQLNPVLAGEDAGIVLLEHATGVRSTFDGNRLSDHASDMTRRTMGEMTIEGEGGTLNLDGQGVVTFRPFGQQACERVPVPSPPDDGFGGGCVGALNAHVVDAMAGRGVMENEAESYLPIITLTELAYQSAREKRRIDVR